MDPNQRDAHLNYEKSPLDIVTGPSGGPIKKE